MSEFVTKNVWLNKETDKAYLIRFCSKTVKYKDNWVSKSLVKSISIINESQIFTKYNITIPIWLYNNIKNNKHGN